MKKSQLLTCVAFLTFFPLVDGMNITCSKATVGRAEPQSKLITMPAGIADYARSLIPFSEGQLNDENSRLTTISQLDDLLNKIINDVIQQIDSSQPIFYENRECNFANGRCLFDRAKKAQKEALERARQGLDPNVCYQRGLEHFSKHVAHALGVITDWNEHTKNHGIIDYSGTFIDIVKTIHACTELKQNMDQIVRLNKSRHLTPAAKQQIDLIAVYKTLYLLLTNSKKVYYGKYNWKINGETVYNELFPEANDAEEEKYLGKKFETECLSLLFECHCLYGVRDSIKFSYFFVPCHYATKITVGNETRDLPAKIAAIYPIEKESGARKFKKGSINDLRNVSMNLRSEIQDDKSSDNIFINDGKENIDKKTNCSNSVEVKPQEVQDIFGVGECICAEHELVADEERMNTFDMQTDVKELVSVDKSDVYKHSTFSRKKKKWKEHSKKNAQRQIGKVQGKPKCGSKVVQSRVHNVSAQNIAQSQNSEMQFSFKDKEIKVASIRSNTVGQKTITYELEERETTDRKGQLICHDQYVSLTQKNKYMDSQFEEFIGKYQKIINDEDRAARVNSMVNKLEGDININIKYLKNFCENQKRQLGQYKANTDIEKGTAAELGMYLAYLEQWCESYSTNEFMWQQHISKYLDAAIKYYNIDTVIQNVESKKKVLRILKDEKYSSKLEYIEMLLLNALENIYATTSNQYVLSQLMAMTIYLDKYYVNEQDNIASAIFSYILENDCGLLFFNLLKEIANNYDRNGPLTITEAIDIFYEPFSHFIIVTSSKSSSAAIISKYGENIKRLIPKETLIKNDIEDKKKGCLDEFEKKFNEAKTNTFGKDAFYLEEQFKELKGLFLGHYNLFNNTDAVHRIKLPLQIKDGVTCSMFYGNIKELKESTEYLRNIINKYKDISLNLSCGLKRLLISVEECIAKKNKLNDSFFMDEVYALDIALHEEQVRYDPMIYKLLNLESDIICLSNIINSNALSMYHDTSTYGLKQELESTQPTEKNGVCILINKFYEIMPHIMRVCNLVSNSNIMDASEMLYDTETIKKCYEAKDTMSQILAENTIKFGKETRTGISAIISYLDKIIKLSVLQQVKLQYDDHNESIRNLYEYRSLCMYHNIVDTLTPRFKTGRFAQFSKNDDLWIAAKIIIKMHDIAMIDHYQIRAIMLSQLVDNIKESGYCDISDYHTKVTVVDSTSLFVVKPDMVPKVLQDVCYALWFIARGNENESKDDRMKQFSENVNPINKYFGENLKEINEQDCKNELNEMVKEIYKFQSLENITAEIDNLKKELTQENTATKNIIASCSFVMQKITNYINDLKLTDKEALNMEMKRYFMNQLENTRKSASVLLAEFN